MYIILNPFQLLSRVIASFSIRLYVAFSYSQLMYIPLPIIPVSNSELGDVLGCIRHGVRRQRVSLSET
jgi:hypothetical protein